MGDYAGNPRLKKLKRAVVKEEFVALTGDIVKAIILNQFIYWSERVQDFDRFIAEEQHRCQQDDTELMIQTANGWIYKSSEDLAAETMLNLSASNMRKHLKYLVEHGWISERTNPVHKWDRTIQYRVNLAKINADLLNLGYILQDYKVELAFFESKNAFSNIENGASDLENRCDDLENQTAQNRKAIPEITTEITNRDYHPSIPPPAPTDNRTLDSNELVGLTVETANHKDSKEETLNKSSPNGVRDRQLNELLTQLGNASGATPGQIREAIRRANQIEKEGKLKGNYLKLVESIAKTVVQEDLIKKNSSGAGGVSDQAREAKRKLIQSLYRS